MRPRCPAVAAMAMAVAMLFMWLGSRGLNEPDEGRYAEVAREMALQSDWLVPNLSGVGHFTKPPLIYWITALSIRAFGVNEWAARLPSALAAAATLWLTLYVAGVLFGPSCRWKAVVILAASIEFLVLARAITTDMLLTLWITSAIAGLVAYVRQGRRLGLAAFYVSMGLGFLTKGPVALLAPLSAAALWRVGTRRAGLADRPLHVWLGLAVTMAIGLSWFIAVTHRHPVLLNYYLRGELYDRIATDIHSRSKPFWFFVPVLAGAFMPWTFFVPAAAWRAWARLRARAAPLAWLFVGWVAVPFVVLSLVRSKLPTYILPLLPGLSVGMAWWWEQACGTRAWRLSVRTAGAAFTLVVSAAVLAGVLLGRLPDGLVTFGVLMGIALALYAALLALSWAGNGELLKAAALPVLGMATVSLMLAVATEGEHYLPRGSASMRDAAAEIARGSRGQTWPVFACDVRAYGIEFYLGRMVDRSASMTHMVLPLTDEQRRRIVEDPARHVAEMEGAPSYVLVGQSLFRDNPVFARWRVAARAGNCVLLASPLVSR